MKALCLPTRSSGSPPPLTRVCAGDPGREPDLCTRAPALPHPFKAETLLRPDPPARSRLLRGHGAWRKHEASSQPESSWVQERGVPHRFS